MHFNVDLRSHVSSSFQRPKPGARHLQGALPRVRCWGGLCQVLMGRGLWVWWVGGVPRVGMNGFVVQAFVAFLVLLLFHHMFKVRIFVLECNVLRPDCNPACRFRDDYLPTLRECGRLAIIGYHESVGCGSGVEEYFHVFLVFSLVSGPCVLS